MKNRYIFWVQFNFAFLFLFFTFSSTAFARSKIIPTVHFDEGSYTIRKVSKPILDDAISIILHNISNLGKVIINGHSDRKESFSKSKNLSKKRAQAVKEYLVQKDVPVSILEIKAWGSERPVKGNSTEEERKYNRRVELYFVDKEE